MSAADVQVRHTANPRRFSAPPGSWALTGLLVVELVLAFAMWPIRHAEFGIIDDHGVVELLRGRPRIPLGDTLPTMAAHFSEPLGRFRPLFWFGWITEGTLWGNNASLWYLDRFLLAGITAGALYWAVLRFVHPAIAAVVALSAIFGPQFETWVRLGASEAYAMPLFALGVVYLVRRTSRETTFAQLWPGLALLALAPLAKENFVGVLAGVLPMAVWATGLRRMRRRDWLLFAIFAMTVVAVLAAVLLQIHRYGVLYLQERSLTSAWNWGQYAVVSMTVWQGLVFAVLALALAWVRQKQSRTIAAHVLGAAAVLFLLQVAFYAGSSTVGRYLYPGILVSAVFWVVAFHGLRPLPDRQKPSGWPRITVAVVSVGLALSVALGCLLGSHMSQINSRDTAHFRTKLELIEREAETSDVSVIVLQPNEPLTDWERVVSLARYLTWDTGLPVMTLPATRPTTGLSRALGGDIASWSSNGAQARHLQRYAPRPRCLSIMFGDEDPVCSLSVKSPD